LFLKEQILILEEPKVYNPNVLPVKVINFSLEAELDNSNMISFIESLEKMLD
jgi:LEA14-like dessication related protein